MGGGADGEACGAYAVEERVEVGEAGLGGEVGLLPLVLAQDVEEAAEFGEGLAAGGGDGVEGLGGAFGDLAAA